MDYSKLATTVRDRAEELTERQDADFPEAQKREADATNAELLRVLARLLEGATPAKAFGAPGDWGYRTPIGAALYDTYKG